jgi:hypothetical protein
MLTHPTYDQPDRLGLFGISKAFIGTDDAHDNLVINGPTGVGKSWLACALGHKACRDNRAVFYPRVPKLFGELALTRGDGQWPHQANPRQCPTPDPRRLGLEQLDAQARHDLLEILKERYGRKSTTIIGAIKSESLGDFIEICTKPIKRPKAFFVALADIVFTIDPRRDRSHYRHNSSLAKSSRFWILGPPARPRGPIQTFKKR